MKREASSFMNIVLSIARIVFGVTFIFSGFVKAVDPIGFCYKIEDYLISFQLVQLIPLALAFAIILIVIEFLIGVSILFGIYRKASTSLAVLFMVVMTPFTLYIALNNPVEDCGCFGDALIISNWNTFYKNIVLLIFALILFVYREKIKSFYSKKTGNFAFAFVLIFAFALCSYNVLYLPILDFRPYKVGVNIPEQMETDKARGDVFKNIYVYEKDGVQQEFTEENFPWEDSTWTFIDLKLELVKKGNEPIIKDFKIIAYNQDSEGSFIASDDITQDVLSRPLSLLVVSLSLDKANEKSLREIHALSNFALKNYMDIYVLTASDGNVVEKWNKKLGGIYLNYATMDELTLKTIIRSNPGILLLKEGTIQAKWSHRNVPDTVELAKLISQSETEGKKTPFNKSESSLLIVCLLFLLPLLGMRLYDKKTLSYTQK
ncbi:MAG: DoxX family protein [Dysgonamonadaceae bacterium]|jgi:uncharacterized membrane protein YphA (DoxX/SURF4 family)|nr:DoxX family protein [Dysgonamonadaceae bacterium]MDD3356531.1 DoxX family protein [Dysgonamonadaceae bacterium]MDD3727363.1 DoxX family protein [Dysgonamonadaceae bacterium]MDD4247162.1 DoxX family protein [Dysgonamonadaceae bacterium]MDD4606147.1 DoxX family protein [Dysgonamonadaceae bacterium]